MNIMPGDEIMTWACWMTWINRFIFQISWTIKNKNMCTNIKLMYDNRFSFFFGFPVNSSALKWPGEESPPRPLSGGPQAEAESAEASYNPLRFISVSPSVNILHGSGVGSDSAFCWAHHQHQKKKKKSYLSHFQCWWPSQDSLSSVTGNEYVLSVKYSRNSYLPLLLHKHYGFVPLSAL